MRRERVMRTREITTTRTQASLVNSFAAVNQVFAAADIQFGLHDTTGGPGGGAVHNEALDDSGFYLFARRFPMTDFVQLLLVRRFAGSEGGAAIEDQGVCAIGELLSRHLACP